jgi:hypothetical protein
MYATLLWFHSNWRWLVLAAGLVAVVHAWVGVLGKRAWSSRSALPGRLFVAALDLQLLAGLALYCFYSPLTHAAFANMRAAMREPNLRFWAVEHGPWMLLVVVLAHVGSVRGRRASSDSKRYLRFGVWYSLVLGLMFFGIPWPWLDVARPLLR